MSVGWTFRISDDFINSHSSKWSKRLFITLMVVSLLISFKIYIETGEYSSFLFIFIPLAGWLRGPSIKES